MSLVDFLDPCPRCDGIGEVSPLRGLHFNDSKPCPDCIGGLVVSEDDIEKVAEAIYLADGVRPEWDRAGGNVKRIYVRAARAAVTTLIERWRTK